MARQSTHKFVVVLVTSRERKDVKDSERGTREAAEGVAEEKLKSMKDYMSSFYLAIEERWSLE